MDFQDLPKFSHIKDFDSWEYKNLLFNIDEKLNSFSKEALLNETKKEWIVALDDWFSKNHRLVEKEFKIEPTYKSPKAKVQSILEKNKVAQEVMNLLQEFIDFPEQVDKKRVYNYLVKNSFSSDSPFYNIYKPLDLIDFNNAVFDYTKIREDISKDINVKDLTLFGHIFHASKYRAIYGTNSTIAESSYIYKMNTINKKHIIEDYKFNINDYTSGQIYMIFAFLDKENKEKFNNFYRNFSSSKPEFMENIWQYTLNKVELENPKWSRAFSNLYESIQMEKECIGFDEIKKRIKNVIEIFLDNQSTNNELTFILALICCDKSIGLFEKLNTKDREKAALYVYECVGGNFNGEHKNILLQYTALRLISTHQPSFSPQSPWDIFTFSYVLNTLNSELTNRAIRDEKEKLCEAIGSIELQGIIAPTPNKV